MAGGKLPPRQKMIGLMYLVLLALLALNVSKDILDAFILVNTSLEKTVINYDEKNGLLYADFNQAKTFDPNKATPLWEKAQTAKKESLALVSYIKSLQSKLIQETENITEVEADTLSLINVNGKDNYDIPTNILIGQSEDGSKGLARELKIRLAQYKKNMLALFSQKQQQSLKIDLKTEDIHTSEGIESWEMGNFYHTPLAASITLLSKIQTDVKNVEYDVVSSLLKYAGKKEFNFDTIVTKVIPNSNYVLLGEPYKADVFLAAFSTTQNPKILIGNYDAEKNEMSGISDTVPVNNGLGQYEVNTSREGIYSYEGVLQLKNSSGGIENFPFKSEYIVAKPSLVVSPDKMNVFYIGPENPVSISVPGVASENIRATVSGSGNKITKTANGKYIVKLKTGTPKNVKVNVSATMPNGEIRNMGNMAFVAKKLPKPEASFLNQTGEMKLTRNEIKNYPIIKASYGSSFVFTGLPLTVTNCLIEIYRNGGRIHDNSDMNSKTIPQRTRTFFKDKIRRGDKIFFSEIRVKDINGQTIKLNGIQIKVR
jgi:gliding motility-associated protein GldM